MQATMEILTLFQPKALHFYRPHTESHPTHLTQVCTVSPGQALVSESNTFWPGYFKYSTCGGYDG